MSELDDFFNGCEQRGRMTLADHLTEAGYVNDMHARKSMETQATRALQGTRYAYLLGKIVFASQNTRALWATGVPRLDDQHARPKFSNSLILSEKLNPVLEKNNFRSPFTEPSVREAVRAVATSSRTTQHAVGTALVSMHAEKEIADERTDSAKQRLADAQQRIAHLEAQNSQLIRIIDRGGIVPHSSKE